MMRSSSTSGSWLPSASVSASRLTKAVPSSLSWMSAQRKEALSYTRTSALDHTRSRSSSSRKKSLPPPVNESMRPASGSSAVSSSEMSPVSGSTMFCPTPNVGRCPSACNQLRLAASLAMAGPLRPGSPLSTLVPSLASSPMAVSMAPVGERSLDAPGRKSSAKGLTVHISAVVVNATDLSSLICSSPRRSPTMT